jgi:hypothetical protein
VEEGLHVPYAEHWYPVPQTGLPGAAVDLADPADGRAGMRVRAGGWFADVRDRSGPVPAGTPLADLVREAGDLTRARALVDFEVSLGHIAGGSWTVAALHPPPPRRRRPRSAPGPRRRAPDRRGHRARRDPSHPGLRHHRGRRAALRPHCPGHGSEPGRSPLECRASPSSPGWTNSSPESTCSPRPPRPSATSGSAWPTARSACRTAR